jgi:hypothetical protein
MSRRRAWSWAKGLAGHGKTDGGAPREERGPGLVGAAQFGGDEAHECWRAWTIRNSPHRGRLDGSYGGIRRRTAQTCRRRAPVVRPGCASSTPPNRTKAFLCVTLARIRPNGGCAQSSPRKMLPSPVCAVVGPTRSSTAGRQVRRSPLPCRRRALDQPVSGRRATDFSTVCGVTAVHRPSMLPSRVPREARDKRTGRPVSPSPRTHIRRGSGAPELDGRPNRPAPLRCWAEPR